MANGDVTLTRREHQELLRHLESIGKHHTRRLEDGVVVEASFPHDAELHEGDAFNEDPMMASCPQCNVIMSINRIRAIHQDAHIRSNGPPVFKKRRPRK